MKTETTDTTPATTDSERRPFTLGSTVRDSITGFQGVAVCRTEHLYGCIHVGVQKAGTDKDGGVHKAEFFDEQRLTVITPGEPVVSPDSTAKSGGPVPGSSPVSCSYLR